MKEKMSRTEVLILVIVIAMLGLFAVSTFRPTGQTPEKIPLTRAVQIINEGQAEKALQDGNQLYIFTSDSRVKVTRLDEEVSLEEEGIDTTKITIENGRYDPVYSRLFSIFLALVPVVLIGSLLVFSIHTASRILKSEEEHKILLLALVVFTFPFGAFIYYSVRKRPG